MVVSSHVHMLDSSMPKHPAPRSAPVSSHTYGADGGANGGGADGEIKLGHVQSDTLYTSEHPPVVESQ